ncbi:MAG: hypothetical protein KAG53_02925 [Endozoicomonadaceae bacterium]|nr:hypothetical protein [Endozoicomonadaceae bacterium]
MNDVISFKLYAFRKKDFINNMHIDKILGKNCICSVFRSVIVFFVGRMVSLNKEQVNLIIKDNNLMNRLEEKGIKERFLAVVSGENIDADMIPQMNSLSKSMDQSKNGKGQFDGNKKAKDQKTMAPEDVNNESSKAPEMKAEFDVTLRNDEMKMLHEMKEKHVEFSISLRKEEEKSFKIYERYLKVLADDCSDEMAATWQGGTTTGNPDDELMVSETGNFSVQSSYSFLKCKIALNNALKDDCRDSDSVANYVLHSVERYIDNQMRSDISSNKLNQDIKCLRHLKSAVLHDLGVCSIDTFAKKLSRKQFKIFQEELRSKVLDDAFNYISISLNMDSLIDPIIESIKNTSAPFCTWLLPDEVELLSRIGGFDNLHSVKPYMAKEDNEILEKIDDAKTKIQKNKDEENKKSDSGKVGEYVVSNLNIIDPCLLEKGNEILKRMEEYKKTLQRIKNKIRDHDDQEEVTKYKSEFSCFMDNQEIFDHVLKGRVRLIVKEYAKRCIKKSMETLSEKSPLPDAVINSTAKKYQLQNGSSDDTWYLFNPITGKFVMWCEQDILFLEGCTQEEAEKSYSENKPLLCSYDKLCFFPKTEEEIKVKAKSQAKARGEDEDSKVELKKIAAPVIISNKDTMLNVSAFLPFTTKRIMTYINENILRIQQTCERNKQYQEELLCVIVTATQSARGEDNNQTKVDQNDKYSPTRLLAQFSNIFSSSSSDLDNNIVYNMEDESKEYPVYDVIQMEIAKICYDVVVDYVQEATNSLNEVAHNIYGGEGLQGDRLKNFKKNMYKVRFTSWEDKWNTNDLKEVLFKKVMASMSDIDKNKKSSLLNQYVSMKTDIQILYNELMNYINGTSAESETVGIQYIKEYIEKMCDLFYKMKYQDPPLDVVWLPQGTTLTREMITKLKLKEFRRTQLRTAKTPGKHGRLPLKEGEIVELTCCPSICFYGKNGQEYVGGAVLTKERLDYVP